MTGISVEVVERGAWTVLTVHGPINSYTHNELQEKTMRHAGRVDMAVDLSGVSSMTSAGIGVLLAAVEDAAAAGKRFVVVAPSEVARLAIESTGFSDHFPTVPSLKELPA
ncbi:MAG: STAS domain-containing protein [Spirochaetes bacterium]|nr:STAS domain-containing protein [Spirochaetota bacterium]MBU1081483.1 STAS domain-containing protein [Spirochaetota bacterium]